MSDRSCSITTDLVPLYIDDVVSDGTKAFVEEHLSQCENCREEYEKLSQNTVIADNASVRLAEAQPLRTYKKRIQRAKMLLVSAVLILLVATMVPLPRRIDHTFQGIRWESEGAQLAEKCEVTLDGWYYHYLVNWVRDDVFKGDIILAGDGDTLSWHTADGGTLSWYAPNVTLRRDSSYADSVWAWSEKPGTAEYFYYNSGHKRVGALTVYDPELNQMRPMGDIIVYGSFEGIFIHSPEWSAYFPAEPGQHGND